MGAVGVNALFALVALCLLEQAPVATPAQESAAADWQTDYDQARQALQAGQFTEAAQAFAALAQTAPDEARRYAAAEQAALARFWAAGGYRLTPPAVRGLGAPPANRRTTDELAVLYTTAVFYGIGSGVVLATWTEPDSPAGGILPALGLAAASAGVVAVLDWQNKLGYAVPQSIVSGLFIGLQEGLAWTLWNQSRVNAADEWDDETVAGLIWAATTAGAVAGGVVGTTIGTTPGRASLMGSAALFSGLVAGLTAAALTESGDKRDDYGMLAAALGLNVGAVGSVLLGHQQAPSIARVRFLDLGGIAGGLLLGGLYWAAAGDDLDERRMMAAVALGLGTGVGTAWFLTREMEPDHRTGRTTAAVTPVIAPASQGRGLVLGLGGAI